eukprot:UN00583
MTIEAMDHVEGGDTTQEPGYDAPYVPQESADHVEAVINIAQAAEVMNAMEKSALDRDQWTER